jgi:hypothetical protein
MYARHAPCAANDSRLRPSRHTRPQSQLCNLPCATSPLPHHCTSCPLSTTKALGPNKLSPSGLQSATALSVGHRTIETFFSGCRTFRYLDARQTRRPAATTSRPRSAKKGRIECGFIFSNCSMACSRVQYPPGLAAESLGFLSCLLGFDAVSL